MFLERLILHVQGTKEGAQRKEGGWGIREYDSGVGHSAGEINIFQILSQLYMITKCRLEGQCAASVGGGIHCPRNKGMVWSFFPELQVICILTYLLS